MSLILDSGALIAYERGDRVVRAFLERAQRSETPVVTTTAAVARALRDASRQGRVVRLLRGLDQVQLTEERARSIGVLLGAAGMADVVDGSIVDAAPDGAEILTSDTRDIAALAESAAKTVIVTPVG